MPEDFEPHTRNEALLNAIRENTGGGTGSVDFEPRTRNEYLLNEIRKNTEGIGSGLPDVTNADNEKIPIVENGKWVVSTADDAIDANSYKPIANSAVCAELSRLETKMYDIQPIVRPCDSTARSALEQLSGILVELVTPVDIDNAPTLFAYTLTGYLLWQNGTKLDSGKMLVEIDLTNNAITLYARGKSSMVSGIMGIDTSWTVTSL